MVYQDDGRPSKIQKELTVFNYDKALRKGSGEELSNSSGAIAQYSTDVYHLV